MHREMSSCTVTPTLSSPQSHVHKADTLPQVQRCEHTEQAGPPGYYHTHKQNTHTLAHAHTHKRVRIPPPQGSYFLCTCTHNLCMQIGFSERSNPLLTFIKTKQRWADTAFWLGGCVFAAMSCQKLLMQN